MDHEIKLVKSTKFNMYFFSFVFNSQICSIMDH